MFEKIIFYYKGPWIDSTKIFTIWTDLAKFWNVFYNSFQIIHSVMQFEKILRFLPIR